MRFFFFLRKKDLFIMCCNGWWRFQIKVDYEFNFYETIRNTKNSIFENR